MGTKNACFGAQFEVKKQGIIYYYITYTVYNNIIFVLRNTTLIRLVFSLPWGANVEYSLDIIVYLSLSLLITFIPAIVFLITSRLFHSFPYPIW
jgi:hypothetical protein